MPGQSCKTGTVPSKTGRMVCLLTRSGRHHPEIRIRTAIRHLSSPGLGDAKTKYNPGLLDA